MKNLIKITCSDTLNALDNLKKKDLNIEHIDINCKDLKEECLSVYRLFIPYWAKSKLELCNMQLYNMIKLIIFYFIYL